ncbi:GNAT family N-acetyltransferase [Lactobacillus panisapium]|uniref:GNAT family N-acetyltransferase n=1 Tax=Lactobacillus panisapium TaxID=2012495 RepID=UPI001C69A82B|nr:GNAT family N-acetyltransferase [Lactobacillus panisapium]
MKIVFSQIQQLSQKNAEIIATKWHYDGEYSFYDMENDQEDYDEIITPALRKDHYFEVLAEDGQLTAFFCLDPIEGKNDQVEVGLGMAPELTGYGLGIKLMQMIEDYVKQIGKYHKIILSVAEFNKRAQKVYQRAGYRITGSEDEASNGGIYRFILMAKEIKK